MVPQIIVLHPLKMICFLHFLACLERKIRETVLTKLWSFLTLSHFHWLQVENCENISRLVNDDDFSCTSRLQGVNEALEINGNLWSISYNDGIDLVIKFIVTENVDRQRPNNRIFLFKSEKKLVMVCNSVHIFPFWKSSALLNLTMCTYWSTTGRCGSRSFGHKCDLDQGQGQAEI